MQDLNRACLIGTMATDPVQRMAGSTAVCNFRLATHRWDKNKTQISEFHSIVCWEKLAENISTFLTKGSRIYVEGRLQTREWVGNDGKNNRTTEIVAENVIFLDKKDSPARSTQSVTNMSSIPQESVTGTNATEAFVMESMDKQDNVQEIKLEDIPFWYESTSYNVHLRQGRK